MDVNEIIERARTVGKLLAQTPRVKAYRDAQQRLEKDEPAQRLLRDYEVLADRLQRQQAQGQQPGQKDVEQFGRFQDQLATNEAIKAWLRAQSDFVELLFSVDRAIQQGMAEALGIQPGGPAGGQPGGRPQSAAAGQPPQKPFIPTIVPPDEAEA